MPLRHYTLTLPLHTRASLEPGDPVVRRLARIFVRELFAILQGSMPAAPDNALQCGAVVVPHRFGATLDRNLHLHVVALDGGYRMSGGDATFVPREGPLDPIALRRIGAAVNAELARSGSRGRGPPTSSGPVRDKVPVVVRVKASDGATRRGSSESRAIATSESSRPRRVEVGGVGVFAGCAVAPSDPSYRGAVARLSRYVLRPAVAAGALSPGPAGRVRYRLAPATADGTTHAELTVDALRERLEAIGAPPLSGRISYHGVLAPRAALRWRVVPTQLSLLPAAQTRPPIRARPAPRSRPPPSPATGARASGWQCPRCNGPLAIAAVEERSDVPSA